jgi:hypothetical protein
MTANQLFKAAVAEVQNLNQEETFIVKELFKGYLWNREKKNDRLRVGILFLNEVASGKLVGVIEVLDKTTAHQQKYRKI